MSEELKPCPLCCGEGMHYGSSVACSECAFYVGKQTWDKFIRLTEQKKAEIAKDFIAQWLGDCDYDHHGKHWGQSIDEFHDYCKEKAKGAK